MSELKSLVHLFKNAESLSPELSTGHTTLPLQTVHFSRGDAKPRSLNYLITVGSRG